MAANTLNNSSSWKLMTGSILLTILVAIGTLVPQTVAITCWECNSEVDVGCETITPQTPASGDKYYKDCSEKPGFDYKLCRKQVQDIDGKIRVIRSCGFEESQKECYTTANPPVKTTVCQCLYDGCNPATRPQVVGLWAIVLSALMGLIYLV